MTKPTDDEREHAPSLWGGILDRPWKIAIVIGAMLAVYAAVTYVASLLWTCDRRDDSDGPLFVSAVLASSGENALPDTAKLLPLRPKPRFLRP